MIVVTGSLGFIGSRVLLELSRLYPGDSLLSVDHPFVTEKAGNSLPTVSFLDHTSFVRSLSQDKLHPKVIIHLGACSSTTEANWDYLKSNNLEYSQELWSWCARNNGRFI